MVSKPHILKIEDLMHQEFTVTIASSEARAGGRNRMIFAGYYHDPCAADIWVYRVDNEGGKHDVTMTSKMDEAIVAYNEL